MGPVTQKVIHFPDDDQVKRHLPMFFFSFSTSEKSGELSVEIKLVPLVFLGGANFVDSMSTFPRSCSHFANLPHVHSASAVIQVMRSSTRITTFSEMARTSSWKK